MKEIDDAIQEVEKLYLTLTGRTVQKTAEPYAPIPAEKNPAVFVEEQLDRLCSLLTPAGSREALVMPGLSTWETDQEVVFCVDVPGARREDVHVQKENDRLHVTARRRRIESAHLLGSDHVIGRYQRIIPLSAELAAAPLEASVEDGILELRLTKVGFSAGESQEVPIH